MVTTESKEVIAESNGDQFWRRKFDYYESVRRVSRLERRGIEFQVKVGLELLRVKRQELKHGEFISFLVKAGFENTDTPGRRLKVARQYMTYVGLIDSPKLVNPAESEVLKALEIAYSENPQFADFYDDRKKNPDVDDFYANKYPIYREERGIKFGLYEIMGFNPYQLADRIRSKWHAMTPTEQVDTFILLHNFLLQLRTVLYDMKELSPEIENSLKVMQAKGKAAEQHSDVMSGIRTEDWEVEMDKG